MRALLVPALSGILSIQIIFSTTPSYARQQQFTRCAKYLTSMKGPHSIPSTSRDYTQAAIEFLRTFRQRHLSSHDSSPGNRPVSASHRSRDKKQQQAAWRLAGVLNETSTSYYVEPGGMEATRQVLMASLFRGEEDILAELERRQYMAELRNLDPATRDGIQARMSANLFLTFASQVIIFPMAMAIFYMFFGEQRTLIFAPFAFAARDHLENVFRLPLLYHYGPNEENHFRNALTQLEPNQWFYRSFDQRIGTVSLKRMRQTGTVEYADYHDFWTLMTYPEAMVGLTGDMFLEKREKPDDVSWLRVDELLTIDRGTGEPVLVVALRMTEKIPPYPKPSHAKKPETEFSGELVPAPNPVGP